MLQLAVTFKVYPVSLLSLFSSHEIRSYGKIKLLKITLQGLL